MFLSVELWFLSSYAKNLSPVLLTAGLSNNGSNETVRKRNGRRFAVQRERQRQKKIETEAALSRSLALSFYISLVLALLLCFTSPEPFCLLYAKAAEYLKTLNFRS